MLRDHRGSRRIDQYTSALNPLLIISWRLSHRMSIRRPVHSRARPPTCSYELFTGSALCLLPNTCCVQNDASSPDPKVRFLAIPVPTISLDYLTDSCFQDYPCSPAQNKHLPIGASSSVDLVKFHTAVLVHLILTTPWTLNCLRIRVLLTRLLSGFEFQRLVHYWLYSDPPARRLQTL